MKVAKRDLEAALSVVSPACGNGGTDITNHFVFRSRPGVGPDEPARGEVLASSSNVFASCPLICEWPEGGEPFTIEAKRLKQWLGAVSDAPLTFVAGNGDVTATAPRGDAVFQSLNPEVFPFWDSMMDGIKSTGTIPAHRLSTALGYVKPFISTEETRTPSMCVAEIKDGSLKATNKAVAAMVDISGLEGSTLRVHGKDISPILNFLKGAGEGEVEVLEHTRALVFRRADSAIFGEARALAEFPNLRLSEMEEPTHWWDLSVEELSSGIKFVSATADTDDDKLHFSDKDGKILMWMFRQQSRQKKTELRLTLEDRGSKEGSGPMDPDEFKLSASILTKVLSSWKGKTIRFGLHILSRRGFLRCVETRDGDTYTTILTFLR